MQYFSNNKNHKLQNCLILICLTLGQNNKNVTDRQSNSAGNNVKSETIIIIIMM